MGDKSLRLSFECQEGNNPERVVADEINYFLDGSNRVITVDTKEKTHYNVEYDEKENTMTITIPSKTLV